MQYDVFNGDADGIFALKQLRLKTPIPEAKLITGVKRDIHLLRRIEDVCSSTITVLDISLDKNRDSLVKLLGNDNRVCYIDHHFAGDIPDNGQLESHIEASAETCTSLIVNTLMEGKYCLWAICGAFGDNLHDAANRLARSAGLEDSQIAALRDLGELFNYNGYGTDLDDLHFHPAELYRELTGYENPLDFYQSAELVTSLHNGYKDDMARAMAEKNTSTTGPNRVYEFPAAPWARRTAGVFSNLKAREKKNAAHAIIVKNDDGSLQISVRAPLQNRRDADTLCRQFPTGGGRAAAAGINNLPPEMLDDFLQAFHTLYT